MRIKFLLLVMLCSLSFGCKKDAKTTITPEEETTTSKPVVGEIDPELLPDKVTYSGVWTTKNATSQTEVILNQNNNEIIGTLAYKEFDNNGKLQIIGNKLIIKGVVENEMLKATIFDDNNTKISAATLTQNDKELSFKVTGKKIKNIDSFTATKRSM